MQSHDICTLLLLFPSSTQQGPKVYKMSLSNKLTSYNGCGRRYFTKLTWLQDASYTGRLRQTIWTLETGMVYL